MTSESENRLHPLSWAAQIDTLFNITLTIQLISVKRAAIESYLSRVEPVFLVKLRGNDCL